MIAQLATPVMKYYKAKYDAKAKLHSQRFIVEFVAAYDAKRSYYVRTTLLHRSTSPIPRPRDYWGAEGRKPSAEGQQ